MRKTGNTDSPDVRILFTKLATSELILVGLEPMELSKCSNSDYVMKTENRVLS